MTLFAVLACGELPIAPQIARSSPPVQSLATSCVSCTFVESTSPLYGALADPDSVNNLPLLATAILRGQAGDSVSVRMVAADSLLAALPLQEYLIVQGRTTDSVQLSSLSTPRVVYRFSAADSVTLYYRFNRKLTRVPGGAIRLTQTASASLVTFDAPWVTTPQAPHFLASISPSDNPACGTLLPLNASGTYCAVNVQIIPFAPADAFVSNGARFQSDPGHGQSHTVRVFFSEPVVAVEVTVYDPTFPGNTMTGRDSTGATVSAVAFPGNGRPGVLSIQTGTITGRISEVVLNAPIGDYVNYSMKVQFADPSAAIAFDKHQAVVVPAIYPFGATSDCKRTTPTNPRNSWGLTLTAGGPNGTPLANKTVSLTLDAILNSGGHLGHAGTRPSGGFTSGITPDVTTAITTDANGHATFSYYPGEFGGIYSIRAAGAGAVKADTFKVGIPLGAVPGNGTDWLPYGIGRDLHSDVYNASGNMQAAADLLATSFTASFPGEKLYFNDMGLPLGGRFDVGGHWSADIDHCSHRWGNALDLRTSLLTMDQFDWVSKKWMKLTHRPAPLYHKGHYHLQTARQF